MDLNIKNEYSKLIKVIMAPVENKYSNQQKKIIDIFNKYNIKVIMTNNCKEAKYQMFTRDPFIVIDDKIIISYMKEKIRRLEINNINNILNDIDDSKKIYLKNDTYVEGGDIIIHNDTIFVGQDGNRTNKKGLDFLYKYFGGKFKIIPLNMINPDEYIPWVHLDCLFNPISNDVALIYDKGFDIKSLNILKKYFKTLVYVSSKEQKELAINVLSIGNNVIIMQQRHNSLIKKIRKQGFLVETLDLYDSIDEQGFVRCLTCPIERK